jgi:Protein of unknown function (DUF3108)
VNSARVPRRLLLAIAAAVLAAHLLLLWAGSGPLRLANPLASATLMTRTITAAPPAPPVQAEHPPAAAPRRQRTAAVEAAPVPVAKEATVPTAAPVPPPAPPTEPPRQAPQAATPHAAASFSIPGSVRLHYKVSAQSRGLLVHGVGELLWRHDGERYDAKLEVSAPLLPPRTQRSTGSITADGLAPLRFSEQSRSEQAAHFLRDQGKVSFSSNRPDAPLSPGAQDRLSVMLQLGALIAGNPGKFGPDASIAIQTVSTREAEQWVFTVEGEEQLQLPGGSVATRKLIRNPRKEFDIKVELWLAPGMDYVPVRLRLTQPNGDWLDQQWSSTDRG